MRMTNFLQARGQAGQWMAVTIWGTAWLLNAYFTLVSVTQFGTGLADVSFAPLAAVGGLLASWPIALTLHLLASGIEGTVWSHGGDWRLWLTYGLILFIDVGTTYAGLSVMHAEMGWTFAVEWLGAGALALALLPEPMVVNHLRAGGVL